MEKIILNAEARTDLGKGNSKHLRKEGKVPGVVYKEGKIGINVQLVDRDLWKVLHTEAGENAVITMNITSGGKSAEKTVILQEAQRDPLNEKLLHVDFHEISLKEKLKVKVPVTIKGEAPGVTEDKGILTQIEWELEVECLPTAIPEHIEVQVDDLRIGDSIHVKDIKVLEGISILAPEDQVVVSVSAPQAEEPEETEEEVEGEGDEPKVIKKGKQEEGDAEGGEAAPSETAE